MLGSGEVVLSLLPIQTSSAPLGGLVLFRKENSRWL